MDVLVIFYERYAFFFQVPYLPEWVLSRLDMDRIASIFTSGRNGMKKTKLSQEESDAFKANMAQPGIPISIKVYFIK